VGLPIAVGERTTPNQLYEALRVNLADQYHHLAQAKPIYRNFRAVDVLHLLADISKTSTLLEYTAKYRRSEGLKQVMEWYINPHQKLVNFWIA
jgi:UDP-N-acetylglucosamine 4-epimerase